MCRLCDLAADLGAAVLVHGSPAQRQLETGKAAEGRKQAVAAFAAAAEAAAKAGVSYCSEPLAPTETNCINRLAEAAAMVREIAHPALKTMVDCCAAARAEPQSMPICGASGCQRGSSATFTATIPTAVAPARGRSPLPILRALGEGRYPGRGGRRALPLPTRRAHLRSPRERLPARAAGRGGLNGSKPFATRHGAAHRAGRGQPSLLARWSGIGMARRRASIRGLPVGER